MPIDAISPVSAVAALVPAPLPRPAPPPVLPEAPRPVTPANAAVHIMRVPSSRVVEAFVSLQRAIGQQAGSPPSAEARPAVDGEAQRPRAAQRHTAPMPLLDLAPTPPPRLDLEA